jgi:hypothetical protein
VNEDNLSNVRQEASRHFRTKKREYLKDKINELESNSKSKNIRDLYRGRIEFKNGYQPRTNMVKVERSDLLEAQNLLGSTAVFLIECRPTFQRYMLPPSSGQ